MRGAFCWSAEHPILLRRAQKGQVASTFWPKLQASLEARFLQMHDAGGSRLSDGDCGSCMTPEKRAGNGIAAHPDLFPAAGCQLIIAAANDRGKVNALDLLAHVSH